MKKPQTLPTLEPAKKTFVFHYPTISENPGNVKRVTVAYTLQRTDNSTETEDEWILSFGATIFTPALASREETIKYRDSLQFPKKCDKCREVKDSCEDCAPKREMYRQFLRRNVFNKIWNKTMHIRTARERLQNTPLRFVLWSEPDPQMKYYQFRRLEQFILKRIHYFGTDATKTEHTQAFPDVITEFAEQGYEIMSVKLSEAESLDRERFLHDRKHINNEYHHFHNNIYYVTNNSASFIGTVFHMIAALYLFKLAWNL